MLNSPPLRETRTAAHSLLIKAIGTLEALGVDVTIDGDPLRYWIVGVPRTEGEIIALASKLAATQSMQRC